MFTWKPIYRELAEKLLAYRDRQPELLGWLRDMEAAGLKVISLDDRASSGETIPLTEIDPFTFFASFNRGTTDDNRISVLESLKKRFGLVSPLPSDFSSIPLVNLQQSWFFRYKPDRKHDDISMLWDIAEAGLHHGPDKISPSLFARCRKIKTVGKGKLTMGLYWLNPGQFLPLDGLTCNYLVEQGISDAEGKIENLSEYRGLIETVGNKLGNDYSDLSHRALLAAVNIPDTIEDLDVGFARLLETAAASNHISPQELADWLSSEKGEIGNRLNSYPQLNDALKAVPLNISAVQRACGKLWVLQNGTDAARRSAFLSAPNAVETIRALLDESSAQHPILRLDDFVDTASAGGYAAPQGKPDSSGAAHFASVLLAALHPKSFVDYRGNRWNAFYRKVTGSNRILCRGGYGWCILRASSFATQLARTPTFQKYFGEAAPCLKASGLAWAFKEDELVIPKRRYWAGGILWGGDESHLDDFLAGNYWQHGYDKGNDSDVAKSVWELYGQIMPGDKFAIKSLGGSHKLTVFYVGEVIKVLPRERKILLKKIERKLYEGKAPSGDGAGNWFNTLLEVTRTDAVEAIFGGLNVLVSDEESTKMSTPELNLILYGPPGTGKTYISMQKAAERARQKEMVDRAAIKQCLDELCREDQVRFVTFHQSYSYEDFIEGIRPELDTDSDQLRYECRDGVFKQMALLALFDCIEPKQSDETAKFEVLWLALVQKILSNPDEKYKSVGGRSEYLLAISRRGNVTSTNVGDPRASSLSFSRAKMMKVYAAHSEKAEITTTAIADTLGVGSHSSLGALLFRELKKLQQVPQTTSPMTKLSKEERCDVARSFLQEGVTSQYQIRSGGARCQYVLVIDEINRGNISKIFGELITLVETDKRIGNENAMRAVLPYSNEIFAVPPNLHLVGTMNSADKSIALVDVALRRRFVFEELMPDFVDVKKCPGLTPEMRGALGELNRRITLRKDRDHQVGHAYFRAVTNPTEFNCVFTGKIIPLLQEYFYNDWDGLRYVLGESGETGRFIVRIPTYDNEPKPRHAWQWCFDAGTTLGSVEALDWLPKIHSHGEAS